jgi:hypothetical protein
VWPSNCACFMGYRKNLADGDLA